MEKEHKDFETIKEILRRYDPVQKFKRKHESESDEEFRDWENK